MTTRKTTLLNLLLVAIILAVGAIGGGIYVKGRTTTHYIGELESQRRELEREFDDSYSRVENSLIEYETIIRDITTIGGEFGGELDSLDQWIEYLGNILPKLQDLERLVNQSTAEADHYPDSWDSHSRGD